jgi:hypothetical protein
VSAFLTLRQKKNWRQSRILGKNSTAADDNKAVALQKNLLKTRNLQRILAWEGVTPKISACQAALLYRSEPWVWSTSCLSTLEGFHCLVAQWVSCYLYISREKQTANTSRSTQQQGDTEYCWSQSHATIPLETANGFVAVALSESQYLIATTLQCSQKHYWRQHNYLNGEEEPN